jgi:hypothetical protein
VLASVILSNDLVPSLQFDWSLFSPESLLQQSLQTPAQLEAGEENLADNQCAENEKRYEIAIDKSSLI